jgi:hypothetical protein
MSWTDPVSAESLTALRIRWRIEGRMVAGRAARWPIALDTDDWRPGSPDDATALSYWRNFGSHRRDLQFLSFVPNSKGRIWFRSQSDKVILAAYQHGASHARSFNGMWAFAIYDREKREFLARIGLASSRFYPAKVVCFCLGEAFDLDGFTMSMDRECATRLQMDSVSRNRGTSSTVGTASVGILRHRQGRAVYAPSLVVRWITSWTSDFAEKQAEEFQRLFMTVRLRMRSDVPMALA